MTKKIKKGNRVRAIVRTWLETETPSEENFFFGKVQRVVNRTKFSKYVQIEGLDRLIPIDRISMA